jgi:hypothetical protein
MAVKNRKGQSILEVLILIPFLFAFVGVLYKITMAVQMAIVNTQYARSQIYVLTSNSPEYPRLQFRLSRGSSVKMFAFNKQDRMVLGVADPKALTSSAGQDGSMEPLPQIQSIGRSGRTESGSSDRGEVTKRTDVRVRNTVGICTQLNAVALEKPMDETNIPSLGSKRWPFGNTVCQYGGMI